MCCMAILFRTPGALFAESKEMFLPECEDVIECINDDTDEDHESLNSIPELVEDSDEEDDAVTDTSTLYASIDGSCATCQVPGRVILSGDSGAHFGREETLRLTAFRVLTNCDVARFMFHLDHVSAHDDTRQYFISLPSLIAHATTAALELPLENDEGEELSWTVGHLPQSDFSPPVQGPMPNGGG